MTEISGLLKGVKKFKKRRAKCTGLESDNVKK